MAAANGAGGAAGVTNERWRVVVTRRLPAPVEAALMATGVDAVFNPTDEPLDAAALGRTAREADLVVCTVSDRIPPAFFDPPIRARALVNFGVGVDHIPLALAREAGVIVTNTPDVLTDDTADLTMLLLLAAMRRASEGERELRDGRWVGWAPTHMLGARLTGKTLGIIGLGRIGTAVARRASRGFDMDVQYFARGEHTIEGVPLRRCATLEQLLESSDAVSVHVASTPDTRHMLGAREFALMRRDAVLVNTARGDIVDEAALIAALEAGTIAGAGLDVYTREPMVPPELVRLPQVTLLPHLGSATRETRVAMGERALANIVAIMAGREPPDRVA